MSGAIAGCISSRFARYYRSTQSPRRPVCHQRRRGRCGLYVASCGAILQQGYNRTLRPEFDSSVLDVHRGRLQAVSSTREQQTKQNQSNMCSSLAQTKIKQIETRRLVVGSGFHASGTSPAFDVRAGVKLEDLSDFELLVKLGASDWMFVIPLQRSRDLQYPSQTSEQQTIRRQPS